MDCTLMKGWLFKKSSYLKAWRLRLTILKRNENQTCTLSTYRMNNNDSQRIKTVTEIIIIDAQTIISHSTKVDGNNTFRLYNEITDKEFIFKTKPICNYNCNDWIDCIKKAILMPHLNCIKRPNKQKYLITNYIEYVLFYYERIYLQSNRNKVIPFEIFNLIDSYFNKILHEKGVSNCNIYAIEPSSPVLLFNTKTYNALKINISNVDNFRVPNPANCGYHFGRNQDVPFNLDMKYKYHSIFRVGGEISTECDVIMTDSMDSNNYNLDAYYYRLPPIPFTMYRPSVTYHNKHLFVVYDRTMYVLDINMCFDEMKWIQIENRLKPSECATLSYIGGIGNQLIIIGGSRSWLYEFNGDRYSDINNRNNIICLKKTNVSHHNAGCCEGVGYDYDKLFVGSNRFVELYDSYKNIWMQCKETFFVHSDYPQLWIDEMNANIVCIASDKGAEWYDVREAYKWNLIKTNSSSFCHYSSCSSVIVQGSY